MNIKSFSLIEILVASMIFMVVVIMTVASFGMIQRSNEATSDLSNTSECARQIENITSSVFKSASYRQPRVMSIVLNSGVYSLDEVDSVGEPVRAAGFAVFEKSSTEGEIKMSAIIKKIDVDENLWGYYYKTVEIPESSSEEDLNDVLNSSDTGTTFQPIHSNVCRALSSGIDEDSNNYEKPFKISLTNPYGGGPSSLSGNSVYYLTLNDVIFSKFSDQTKDDKTASRVYLEVINNITSI